MKKILTNLLALLGLATACGQQGYENAGIPVGMSDDAYEVDTFTTQSGQTDVSGIPSQLEADGVEVRIRHNE